MHVIIVYIYYFHGYILYHLLCSIFMYCYHVLFMYCVHVLISYIVFMYCFMYCSCTIFLYCFPVIIFIWLSLSCTVLGHVLFVYCHILSYTILYRHILCICIFTLTIEVAFTTNSRGNLVLFVIQSPCDFTFNGMIHFDYRIDIHDRFERESRPVCHSLAMCFRIY